MTRRASSGSYLADYCQASKRLKYSGIKLLDNGTCRDINAKHQPSKIISGPEGRVIRIEVKREQQRRSCKLISLNNAPCAVQAGVPIQPVHASGASDQFIALRPNAVRVAGTAEASGKI